MKTYTARYEGGKDDGRVIYARRPVGNLIGELPLGSGPIVDPKQSLDRTDGGDAWEHAVFMTVESRRRIVVTRDPEDPLTDLIVDNFEVHVESELDQAQWDAISPLIPRHLRGPFKSHAQLFVFNFDRMAPTELLAYLRKEGLPFKLNVRYEPN